ncbi:hypothetical protein [Achromobacter aloeverae]|uniref:Uncharacterized protein n=1 Tax=Achromobacter aloeverae TaxID=1750518 RepID=A0A4Q1HQL4_9BURK|nr:hypothetical protein [Achromobacter aloeverae]RXN92981.1 hypothetical protein C7R54_04425 [Achromobacter aloeverae]
MSATLCGAATAVQAPPGVGRSPDTPPAADACAWPVAGSVEALLQAETAAALRARLGVGSDRSHMDGAAGPSLAPSPAPHADRVAVAAIYGVGRRLHVDVHINGQVARYRAGRRWPEHAPGGGAGVYALAAVLGECVRLQGGDGARIACLDAKGHREERRN